MKSILIGMTALLAIGCTVAAVGGGQPTSVVIATDTVVLGPNETIVTELPDLSNYTDIWVEGSSCNWSIRNRFGVIINEDWNGKLSHNLSMGPSEGNYPATTGITIWAQGHSAGLSCTYEVRGRI